MGDSGSAPSSCPKPIRVGGPMISRTASSEGSGCPWAANARWMQDVIVARESARTPSRSNRTQAPDNALRMALGGVVGRVGGPRVARGALVGASRAAQARVLAHGGVGDPVVLVDRRE